LALEKESNALCWPNKPETTAQGPDITDIIILALVTIVS